MGQKINTDFKEKFAWMWGNFWLDVRTLNFKREALTIGEEELWGVLKNGNVQKEGEKRKHDKVFLNEEMCSLKKMRKRGSTVGVL